MKNNRSIKIILIAIISILNFTSCKQEGCMDPDSKTFNADADKDDGSCKYEGSIVFYYKESTAAELLADGSAALTYYVDGSIIGSSAANVYFTAAPNCGANGSVSKTIDLGSDKSKSIAYKVIDDLGYIIWEGSYTVKANTCNQLELLY
jgi:hypothetical protein